MSHSEEHILVIKRALFDELGAFQGIHRTPGAYVDALLSPENNFFLRRDLAEDDPGYKQIIPYCIFHHQGKVLHYVRGKKGGESRLHALGSVGIGGHVDRIDAGEEHRGEATYLQGVAREIAEELKFEGTFNNRIVALLNDDSNPVGQVHLGIVHWINLEADDPKLKANESPILDPVFRSVEDLDAMNEKLETWSRLCLPAMHEWMAGDKS